MYVCNFYIALCHFMLCKINWIEITSTLIISNYAHQYCKNRENYFSILAPSMGNIKGATWNHGQRTERQWGFKNLSSRLLIHPSGQVIVSFQIWSKRMLETLEFAFITNRLVKIFITSFVFGK